MSVPSWPDGESGDSAVAIYHAHGKCTPGKDNDNFSRPVPEGIQGDTFLSTWYQIPNFLEMLGGIIKRFDLGNTLNDRGHVITIRNSSNRALSEWASKVENYDFHITKKAGQSA